MALHPAIKSVRSDNHKTTEIKSVVHADCLDWPNGLGMTPCSIEYRNTFDEAARIKPDHVNMDDLSPSDYQRWNELQNTLANLQAHGHLGKSIRF